MSGRVRVLVWKEWAELVRRPSVILMTLLPPVLFFLVALIVGLAAPALLGGDDARDPDLDRILEALSQQSPELGDLEPADLLQIAINDASSKAIDGNSCVGCANDHIA